MISRNDGMYMMAVTFLAAWFVFLCSLHLTQQRPLWNDEAAVFESIQHFSPRQMFHDELRAYQVFPRAYLFAIQQLSKLFDFSLWSLRMLPFVCMMVAFFLWLKIARKAVADGQQVLAFAGSWLASGMMLYYSAELKQYSMDVLVGAVFIYFLYHQKQWQQSADRRYVWILAGLPLFGFFSYPAFLFMMLPLWNLVLSSVACKPCRRHLAVYLCSMAVVLALAYLFDMRLRHLSEVTAGFGDYFVSFASAGEFFKTFGEGVNNLFSRWFISKPKFFRGIVRGFTGFALIYMFVAYFRNRKRDGWYVYRLESIAFVLFLEMFLVGCLKKYPFTVPRTSLFYAPVVLYMTVRGLELAGTLHPALYRLLLALYYVFLGFLIVMQTLLAFWGRLSFVPTLW